MKEQVTHERREMSPARTQSLEVFGSTIRDQVLRLAAEKTKPGSTEPVRVSVDFVVNWKWRTKDIPRVEIDPFSIDLCWEVCADYPGQGKTVTQCYFGCSAPMPDLHPIR